MKYGLGDLEYPVGFMKRYIEEVKSFDWFELIYIIFAPIIYVLAFPFVFVYLLAVWVVMWIKSKVKSGEL